MRATPGNDSGPMPKSKQSFYVVVHDNSDARGGLKCRSFGDEHGEPKLRQNGRYCVKVRSFRERQRRPQQPANRQAFYR